MQHGDHSVSYSVFPDAHHMEITYANLLTGIYILVGVMLVVILYNLLFVVVDLRKIMRRISSVSGQVESVVAKPLEVADQAMEWAIHQLQGNKHHHKKHDGHRHE